MEKNIEQYEGGFERNYNLKLKNYPREIVIESSMLDFDHAIWVEIKISKETRTIAAAAAKMPKIPHQLICQKSFNALKNIIGLKIEHGLSKKLKELLGKNSGCVHIFKLVWLAADEAANYLGRFATLEDPREFLKNTCVAYREDDLQQTTGDKQRKER